MIVDVLGDGHRIGTLIGHRSGQVGAITVHDADRIGVGSHRDASRKGQYRVAHRVARNVGHRTQAYPVGGISRITGQCHPEPVAVGDPNVRRLRTAVSHDHVGERHVAVGQTARRVTIDVLGDSKVIAADIGRCTGKGRAITVHHGDRVAVGACALPCCKGE